MGVLAVPAKGVLYFAEKSKGAFRQALDTGPVQISAAKDPKEKVTVAKSRSHSSPQEDRIISSFGDVEEIIAGSSLKFCYVAEGKADIYLRLGRTMEWDTAAGHCIAETAGAKIFDLRGATLLYNKEGLDNSGFFCLGGRADVAEKIKEYIQDS